ncbi:MAG: sulfite exporter TauE/SafE family protein [Clostridia bacterium]|nr:sulfite exporter TauE/SafE family protein [Clostridia bacterium]
MEILIGIIAGMITSIGMGGGTILILLLTIFLGVSQRTAQATNLVFFIPTAITTIIINIKNKNIDFKTGINIVFFGVLGSIGGALAASKVDVRNLRKYFGIFLVCIAIHEIYNYYKLYIKKEDDKNEVS